MNRFLFIILKVFGALVAFVLVALLAPTADHMLHDGTLVLIFAASLVLAFAGSRLARVLATGYLTLVLAVTHGVDKYFWVGVWNHGFPWPYATPPTGVLVGSVGTFIEQISLACFALLSVAAGIMMAAHWLSRQHSVLARR
jgi:hypothetical protein